MVDLRRIVLDMNVVFRKLAHFFGVLSLKSEKWYYDLTEKERK